MYERSVRDMRRRRGRVLRRQQLHGARHGVQRWQLRRVRRQRQRLLRWQHLRLRVRLQGRELHRVRR
jgi:hypothetical protein